MIYNKVAREEFEQLEYLMNTHLNGIFSLSELNETTVEIRLCLGDASNDYPYLPTLWTLNGNYEVFEDNRAYTFAKQSLIVIDSYCKLKNVKLPEDITNITGKYCVSRHFQIYFYLLKSERIDQVRMEAQLADLQNDFDVYVEEHYKALIKYVENNINWNKMMDDDRLELFNSCLTSQAKVLEERLSLTVQGFGPH
ncbi:unnamed protein product [Rodentolepis nana]|uniref:Phage protein n=1 Tax=Rodentolepis nana TaxID=102285 RepID=A0A0R3TSA9_RODNA|nr:unnamed protein product [Rodentolepis nana]